MLHLRKGVVEVVEQAAPFLVRGRASEALGVVFQGLPVDQEDVPVGLFQALLQLVGDVALGRREDRLGLAESGFEVLGLAGLNV